MHEMLAGSTQDKLVCELILLFVKVKEYLFG